MNIIQNVKAIAERLTSATRTVHEEIGAMRAPLKELPREIRRLGNAPIPADEIRERIRDAVHARGAAWLRDHGTELFHMSERFADRDALALGSYSPVTRHAQFPPAIEADPVGYRCATEPEAEIRRLFAMLEAVPFEPGPPSAARPELIARKQQELAELGQAEEIAIDELAAAGVVIQHRPEVLQRRARERETEKIEESAVADRKARQVALDADAADKAGRGRIAQSEYISGPIQR
jgi:hypothetical protein